MRIRAFATNVDKLAIVYPELNITPAQIAAMKTTRPGALIGRPLAKKYGWKVGDKIPVGTTIWTNNDGSNNWAFDIVGIFDPTPQFARSPLGSAFWINYDYWDEARKFDNHRVHQFIVQIDDPHARRGDFRRRSTNCRRTRRTKPARKPKTPRCSRSSSNLPTSISSPTRSSAR